MVRISPFNPQSPSARYLTPRTRTYSVGTPGDRGHPAVGSGAYEGFLRFDLLMLALRLELAQGLGCAQGQAVGYGGKLVSATNAVVAETGRKDAANGGYK